jgi:serine/threonine-protein kinase HipA
MESNTLAVWLFNHLVGYLSLDKGKLSFCYTSDWLSDIHAQPLSHSLPLQEKVFDDNLARPFFSGLLPEGRPRRLIAKEFHISLQNDFSLLDIIGGECAGAVSFIRPQEKLLSPHLHDASKNIKWLSESELLHTLEELPHRPMLAGDGEGYRLSLAGAQDKLPVVYDGHRIGLPLHGMPSSHILKPTILEVNDSVTNEGFCMALAKLMQLQPANAIIEQVQGVRFLLVERYDRVKNSDGILHRLHQEDFCQALGCVPEMKYQNEGGPSLGQCFDFLRNTTNPHAPQLLRFFDYVVFNTLIGNHDAHGKNFSLLYDGKVATLAPLYDALCTAVYPKLTSKMAMKIGSKYKFSEIHMRHWDELLDSAKLNKSQGKKHIISIAKRLVIQAKDLQSNPHAGFSNNDIVNQIVNLIEQRCSLTIMRLSIHAPHE